MRVAPETCLTCDRVQEVMRKETARAYSVKSRKWSRAPLDMAGFFVPGQPRGASTNERMATCFWGGTPTIDGKRWRFAYSHIIYFVYTPHPIRPSIPQILLIL
jgi:hypothetical protein